MSQKVVVQARESRHMQMGARLDERPVGHPTNGLRAGAQYGEDVVHARLLRGATHAQQRGRQRWKWQHSSAREGSWVAGMARELREGARPKGFGPVLQQGLYEFTSLNSHCELNSEKPIISNTYRHISGCRSLEFHTLGCRLIGSATLGCQSLWI